MARTVRQVPRSAEQAAAAGTFLRPCPMPAAPETTELAWPDGVALLQISVEMHCTEAGS